MTDNLPEYHGNWVQCTKCGMHSEARCQYVPATPETQFALHAIVPVEHLEMTCLNCGYRWPVRCRDSEVEQ